jgi:hypothetical protein
MGTIVWTAPSAEEQELWNAQQRDDKNAYMAALARTDVFVARPIDAKAKSGFFKDSYYATVRRGLKYVLPIYTRGVVPDAPPEGAYWDEQMFPQWVQQLARHRTSIHVLVNAGTPLERDLSAGEAAGWMRHNSKRVLYLNDLRGTVRTLTNEPQDGELARGLACNAHLSVTNGRPWNTMERPYVDYVDTVKRNKQLWLIDGPVDWQNKIDKLLDREKFPWPADDVFSIRMANDAGVKPTGDLDTDTAALTEAVNTWCTDRQVPGHTRSDMRDIAQWIPRVESWMRRDEVLRPDEIVQTQAVFHWARCINMAREGYALGYWDRTAAEQITQHAGGLCARAYEDWRQLSAGYIIGRVIQMGREGQAETLYTQSLTRHRLLMQDPASPWARLSLR